LATVLATFQNIGPIFSPSSGDRTNCATTAVENENTFLKLDFGADAIKKLMVVSYKLF
jgi:hypothetical protein